MAYPALVALMMQYREGLSNPGEATWKGSVYRINGLKRDMDAQTWLNEQLEYFGFKPTEAKKQLHPWASLH
jgi:hypothetical protein